MASENVSLLSYLRLLRSNANFRKLWLAQVVSELGDWLYSIAVYSLILSITGSARAMAFAVILQVLPQVLIAPAAGVINDRISRKKVMIYADVGRAIIVLCMILVQSPDLLWLLYVLMLLESIMWGFFEPARASVIPNITVGRELLVANTLSSITWSFNLAVGSAIGGGVAVLFGRSTVFLLDALTFLVSALLISRMKFFEPHLDGQLSWSARELFNYRPVLEGIRYIVSHRALFVMLLAKGGLGLMGSSWVLLPLYGERVFPVGVEKLGHDRSVMLGMSVLMAARGVGSLLGPLVGSYWAGYSEDKLRRGIFWGFLLGAAGYIGLGVAPGLIEACLAVTCAHAGGSIIWVFSTTLLQLYSQDRFRGRVFSADYGFLVSTMSATTYLSGLLVDVGLGVRLLAIGTGLLALLPTFGWLILLRNWHVWTLQDPGLPNGKSR